jgi:hypothetical protein
VGGCGRKGREAARQAIQGPCRGRGSPDSEREGEAVGKRGHNGDRRAQGKSNCVLRVSDSRRRSWGLEDGSVAAECWR